MSFGLIIVIIQMSQYRVSHEEMVSHEIGFIFN